MARQLVQSVRDGTLELVDAARPTVGPTQVLVQTRASLISSGTERAVRQLASGSLLDKARARPDLVRQVVKRARTEGVRSTVSSVRSRLGERKPLGYSAAGVALEVGEAVAAIRPGMRVATGGAGHAEQQLVAGPLAVPVPDNVSFEQASFATVSCVALHGLRLAEIGPGARVLVVGLGLIGQLTARIGVASGALVTGVDVKAWNAQRAQSSGIETFIADDAGWESTRASAGATGYDAVLITAATPSSDPIQRASTITRDRGVIVVVGDVGLELDRRPLYERELTVRVARSYGPGRYETSYEEWGVDYPAGQVRWTEGRNLSAILDLMAAGRLSVDDLITHRYSFDDAADAYELIDAGSEPYLGVVLTYATTPAAAATAPRKHKEARISNGRRSALIGAGHFAREVLLPAAKQAGFGPWTVVASAAGVSAEQLAVREGFDRTGHADEAVTDPGTDVIFVASTHDAHASQVAAALRAGKHVFCEKPLALGEEELDDIVAAWESSPGGLMVGFNRRWSQPVTAIKSHMAVGSGPLQIIYRVSAGRLADDHWLKDRRMGGRLLGEACHFLDTCNFIVDTSPVSVWATSSNENELLLAEDFTIVVTYADGSQAVIVYATGGPSSLGKEWIQVIGRERSATLDSFRSLALAAGSSPETKARYRQDKGHSNELRAFASLLDGALDPSGVTADAITTTRTTLAAVRSLMTGQTSSLTD